MRILMRSIVTIIFFTNMMVFLLDAETYVDCKSKYVSICI